MKPKTIRVIQLLLIGILCVSCGTAESEYVQFTPQKWAYSDLRVIDPVDTDYPDQDIIAAYMREGGSMDHKLLPTASPTAQIEIRLDFLDLDFIPSQDIYIAFDHLPGGTHTLPSGAQASLEWDTLLYLPAQGAIQSIDSVLKPLQNLALRITRDATLDIISLSLHLSPAYVPASNLRAQVFVTSPGDLIAVDQTVPFALDQSPPPPAEVLFVFWNVYPAYTPAQALRRWDGAHTGPIGGRHGLYNLLRAARNLEIPLVLLDIKSPARLSALDFSRSLSLIQELNARDLLSLPDVIPFTYPSGRDIFPQTPQELIRFAASDSRSTADLYGLPASQMLYAPNITSDINGYTHYVTLSSADQPHALFFRKGQARWTMIPFHPQLTGEIQQVSPAGPTLATRQEMVSQALRMSYDPEAASALVLGGDLVATTWGDPQSVRETLRYISAHPWIKLLTEYDLNSHTTTAWTAAHEPTFPESIPTFDPVSSALLSELHRAPYDPLVSEAWHSYADLISPVYPLSDELMALRANYVGQVALLLAAARWNATPSSLSSCQEDLDFDGQPECVLANEYLLGFFDPAEGSLTHLFSRSAIGEVHQWIAPSAQFTTATSDPSLWQLDAGLRADPSVIPGAFAEPGTLFSTQISADRLVFERPGTVKTYHLSEHGLEMEYTRDQSTVLQMPVVVDPWLRFSPAWAGAPQTERAEQSITWGIPESAQLTISTDAPLTQNTYRDTWLLMGAPENPNYDYPPGHYLPFPISLITIDSPGNATISLVINE